jgi:hypothetical protein
MAETTRKSVLAVNKEVTVGTPVLPSSGNSFVALQDGFEMEPSFETLDNNELSPNVGSKAPILGNEQPTASISHYIRAEGTEGSAPLYAPLVESAIGEEVAAHATERLTAGGSTAGTSSAAAVVALASGGSDFERGKAFLLKDGTNGYAIRNVDLVSVNNLTSSFNLSGAPAAGVGTGRATLYKPADVPPALTLSLYRGNGAALEVMAGGRVSEMSIEANAGEILNGAFTIDGTAYYFDAIEITASTDTIDFNDGGVKVAAVANKLYKDPHELASALQDAMNAVSSGITVVYSDSDGKFTIAKTAGTLSLLWNTGANTGQTIGGKLGFSTAADDTGFLTYTSDNAQVWSAPYTPSSDANVNPLVVKANEVMLGDFDDYGCSAAQSFTATISNTLENVPDICEESGIAEKLLSQRQVTVECVLTLQRHDADKFRRFREGSDVKFAFNGGVKSGGNWVAGRCVNLYLPQAKVSSYKVGDANGVVTIEMTLTAYVPASGAGEVYLNFV